ELDGALASVDGIGWRMPYQSDPQMRSKINDGTSFYTDIHLSESGMMVRQGFFGKVDFAVIEATRITADGDVVLTSSVGNNAVYCDTAEKVII
ncbi:acetyl-CoA hydrolase, partial [Klebsiella pneumoniae]|nr:acetyl-CoA hydrolase [Klebsiella pneumoniae]